MQTNQHNWNNSLDKLVRQLGENIPLSAEERFCLGAYLPTDFLRIDTAQVYKLLLEIYTPLKQFTQRCGLPLTEEMLWRFYAPLAVFLLGQKSPFFLGIVGMQGTGKTTLCAVLQEILQLCDRRVLCLSLDDLYKTYRERQILQQIDPRLRWRGVPSTHDVQLGVELFEAIQQGKYPLAVPRFDKSLHDGAGDRLAPEIISYPVDIVLFEGWFVGVPYIANLPKACTAFTRDCNHKLLSYQPLWQFLDYLVALIPTDYSYSLQWRQLAEQRQIAQGKGGMSPAEIAAFVAYFGEALPPEIYLPEVAKRANWVVYLDGNRHIVGMATGSSNS